MGSGKEKHDGGGRTVPLGRGHQLSLTSPNWTVTSPLEGKDHSASLASNQSAHPGCLIAANTVEFN